MQIQFPIIFMDFYTTLQEQSQSNFTKDMQNLKTRHRNSLETAFVGLFLSSLPSFLFLNPNTPLPTCFSFLLFFFSISSGRERDTKQLLSHCIDSCRVLMTLEATQIKCALKSCLPGATWHHFVPFPSSPRPLVSKQQHKENSEHKDFL